MANRLKSRASALLLGIVLAVSLPAIAAVFPYFGPVTGILKGSATDYHTTAAASTDVAALWAGTCNSSTFLGGDGTCRAVSAPSGSALTRTNDTNVTVTLGGSPASALLASTSLTMGWSGTLAAARGGTGVGALGDLTKVNDTNVTLTLGGTPTGALINSTSLTLGWTGTLAAARGGTGVGTLGDLTRVNDTNVTLTLGGTPTGALVTSTSMTLGWSGTLAAARGGTDGASPTDDSVMVGNGTVWQTKALTSCSTASSAVTYNTSTNAWGCNTITAGAPGGSTTQLQYNNASAFGGTAGLTWDGSKLTTPATAVGSAGINIPAGTAPTSPVNGDVWTTTAGIFVRVNGSTVGPLLDSAGAGVTQSTATFTVTAATGLTTTPSESWTYVKTGNTVTIRWPNNSGLAGTSNNSTFISGVGDIPAAIRPTVVQNFCGTVATDNSSTSKMGGFSMSTAGTLTFLFNGANASCGGTAWTASGAKGFSNAANGVNTFTYLLN